MLYISGLQYRHIHLKLKKIPFKSLGSLLFAFKGHFLGHFLLQHRQILFIYNYVAESVLHFTTTYLIIGVNNTEQHHS